MRIACTGHMDLTSESVSLVRSAVRDVLGTVEQPLTGISCLARGADSIFAEEVVRSGGILEVVLPSPHYRANKVRPDHIDLFDMLVSKAAHVLTLPFAEVGKEAYEAANERLIGHCDRLVAIWDGQPGTRSGTGSVVEHAQSRSVPVQVIWPRGASRCG